MFLGSQPDYKGKDMPAHRFSRFEWQLSRPQTATTENQPSFVTCSNMLLAAAASQGWTWQQEVFRMAYELARANQAISSADYRNRLFLNWN
jgi:hypothetical protein